MIPSSEMSAFLFDLKEHLNFKPGVTKHDAELYGKLQAAFELAEAVAGRSFYPDTATETLDASGVLSRSPVSAITSVVQPNGYAYALTYSANNSIVYGARAGTVVTYTYGQTAPTPAQREAVLLIAAHLWETQRAPSSAGPLGDEETGFAPGYGFAVPNRARDLLRPPSFGPVVA